MILGTLKQVLPVDRGFPLSFSLRLVMSATQKTCPRVGEVNSWDSVIDYSGTSAAVSRSFKVVWHIGIPCKEFFASFGIVKN